jgi:hypothetical protein
MTTQKNRWVFVALVSLFLFLTLGTILCLTLAIYVFPAQVVARGPFALAQYIAVRGDTEIQRQFRRRVENGDSATHVELNKMAYSSSTEDRRLCAATLSENPNIAERATLLDLTRDADGYVRGLAVKAIGGSKDLKMIPYLMAMEATEKDVVVKAEIQEIIADLEMIKDEKK